MIVFANTLRIFDIGFAFLAVMAMLPFAAIRRLNHMVYPALLLLLIYNLVNIFTEIGRWNTHMTWRLPLNLLAGAGCLLWGIYLNRLVEEL